MTTCTDNRQKDLLSSRWAAWVLWGGPWLLILIGEFTGTVARTVLWTAGFSIAGAACLVNARRCGRRHCFYTGPLYLLVALASLLFGLHLLPLGRNGWSWILAVALAGTLFFCCVLEALRGKYVAGSSPQK